MNIKNDLILRAAKGDEVSRVPVWLMRQAGRILPEYRKIRASLNGFIELVKNSELAAEVTLQPVDILGVDAAIIFSDILVVPEAMGLPYEMIEKKGPYFPKTIQSQEDIHDLKIAQPEEDLHYVLEAIKLTKEELNGRVPLIGFCGAPFTLFCYMVEGSGSKTFSKAKRMLYTQPEWSHQILKKITESSIQYLKAQIKAGVDMVQVFDSWAGILGPDEYREFSLKYIADIVEAVREVPVTVFARGAHYIFPELQYVNCQVIGLDWTVDIEQTRSTVGMKKTLQGNLDPCALYGSFKDIEKRTKEMLTKFGKQRYIANLGHGVYPDTSPEKVKCFIETVKSF